MCIHRLDAATVPLSANALELSSNSALREDQLRDVLAALNASGRTVKANEWFAILGVGDVTAIQTIRDMTVVLTAVQTPVPTNGGHASIFGLPPFGSQLAPLAGLALAEVARRHQAVQVKNL
jgi:hypothetical protein